VITDDNGEEFRLYASKLMNKVGIIDTIRAPVLTYQPITSGALLNFPVTIKRIEIQLVYNKVAGNFYSGTLFIDNLRVSYPKLTTSVTQRGTGVPGDFRLYQNYPNPFNATTRVRFRLPARAEVAFGLYDILGRERFVTSGVYGAGEHVITIDGGELTSGVYFLRERNLPQAAIKLLLLK
jgi:hypothetical protein